MPLNKITALAVAGIMSMSAAAAAFAQDFTPDPAIASMSAEQLVETRQATMMQNGGIIRNAGNLSGADAVAAADTLIQNFTNLLALYPEGSIVGDSRALPIIWEEKEAFEALFMQAREAAVAMKAAAESGDAAGFGAGAQTIGGLCGQCHGRYRS
jgi:cytochrome c556